MVVLFEISLQSPGQDTSIRTEPTGGGAPPTPAPQAPAGETRQPNPAPAATPSVRDACMQQLPIFAAIGLVFYFLMIRPQQKQEKARREMLGKMQKGDRVVTNSGLHGVVATVGQDTVQLVIDTEGRTKITVDRGTIGRVLGDETPPKSTGTAS